jgi:hypothetical protein
MAAAAQADVWFVDKDNNSGLESGRNWPAAFTSIQAGIDAAAADGGGEVWVAEGVYDNLRVSPFTSGVDTRNTGSVQLMNGVDLYGGFLGTEENRDARDAVLSPTIIDGSTSREGEPALMVMIGADNVILDGFTLTGGRANDIGYVIGGGIRMLQHSMNIANCTFENLSATDAGGAVSSIFGVVNFTNCTFRTLTSFGLGGAVFHRNGTVTFTDCTFENISSFLDGGAIQLENADASIIGSTFTGVASAKMGGAINADVESLVQIYQSRFVNNSADLGGAVASMNDTTIRDSIFRGNTADTAGGALYSVNRLVNCTLAGNSAPEGGALWYADLSINLANVLIWDNGVQPLFKMEGGSARETVRTCLIQGGFTATSDGTVENIIDADPQFINFEGGDLRVQPFSPVLDAGITLGASEADVDGVPRPQGHEVDIGAHEQLKADPNDDGITNASDIQIVINEALGLDTGFDGDINGDGGLSAIDVQLVINAVLGIIL